MAASTEQPAQALTLSELVRAYALVTLDGSDTRLRKWTAALGELSAWSITSEQLEVAAQAMLEHGYKPSAVNRDLSALGSTYRWAKAKRLSPRGFRSPTLSVTRYEEPIRRVEVSSEQIEKLRQRALAFKDRRFGVFVSLLIDTGARKSEVLDRRWKSQPTHARPPRLRAQHSASTRSRPRQLIESTAGFATVLAILGKGPSYASQSLWTPQGPNLARKCV